MSIAKRIKTFFQEVVTEARKTDWPRRKETVNYTLIVLGISFGVAAFLGILDFVFTKLIGLILF